MEESEEERSVNPKKGHMLKLCILMGRVCPFLQRVDETLFFHATHCSWTTLKMEAESSKCG
jgi:hypothetical protein